MSEESDDDSEGQENESGIIVKVWDAAWLDPGGLDPIHAPARGSGRSGLHGLDCRRDFEAAGGRDRASAAGG